MQNGRVDLAKILWYYYAWHPHLLWYLLEYNKKFDKKIYALCHNNATVVIIQVFLTFELIVVLNVLKHAYSVITPAVETSNFIIFVMIITSKASKWLMSNT